MNGAALRGLQAPRGQTVLSRTCRPPSIARFVLVDAMQAMNAGPAAVADLERSLTEILACFRAGRGSLLTDWFARRIDRILVAATKADHIHHESHDRLQAIARRLTDRALERANFSGAAVDVLAMAAVRATREGTARHGKEELPVIIGTPIKGETIAGERFDGKSETAIFPGDLPADPAAALAADAGGGQRDPVRALPPAQVGEDRRGPDALAAAYPARPRLAVPARRSAGMTKRRQPASFRIEREIPPVEQPAREEIARDRKPPRGRPGPRGTRRVRRLRPDRGAGSRTAAGRAAKAAARGFAPSSCGRRALLLSLAVGLWTERLVRELFGRADWLGWVGLGLAIVALAALLVIIVREAMALARLASVARMHERGVEAIASNDPRKARALVDELAAFVLHAARNGPPGGGALKELGWRRDRRRRPRADMARTGTAGGAALTPAPEKLTLRRRIAAVIAIVTRRLRREEWFRTSAYVPAF